MPIYIYTYIYTCVLAVRGMCFYFFIPELGPELSIWGLDPFQTLDYSLQLRSVQFSAYGVKQVSRSSLNCRYRSES